MAFDLANYEPVDALEKSLPGAGNAVDLVDGFPISKRNPLIGRAAIVIGEFGPYDFIAPMAVAEPGPTNVHRWKLLGSRPIQFLQASKGQGDLRTNIDPPVNTAIVETETLGQLTNYELAIFLGSRRGPSPACARHSLEYELATGHLSTLETGRTRNPSRYQDLRRCVQGRLPGLCGVAHVPLRNRRTRLRKAHADRTDRPEGSLRNSRDNHLPRSVWRLDHPNALRRRHSSLDRWQNRYRTLDAPWDDDRRRAILDPRAKGCDDVR